jgi:hypothetical protein
MPETPRCRAHQLSADFAPCRIALWVLIALLAPFLVLAAVPLGLAGANVAI